MGYVSRMGLLDGWRFCPLCAGAARGPGKVTCTTCGYEVWANPVPGAQALVERDGRVLLGRRRDDPAAACGTFPAASSRSRSTRSRRSVRELREETGLEIEPTEFLGMWMQPYNDRNVLSSPGSRGPPAVRSAPVTT